MKKLFGVFDFSFLKKLISKNTFRNSYILITLILISLSFLISLFASCDTTEPPNKLELTLKLEDVSCTEAWLQLTTNNIQLPATVNLIKNDVQSEVFVLNTKDSLLYIDSLLPNQSYKFLATMQSSSNASNELSVTTMDTTSHNFTWQTFTFGEHSSSTLFDVAIIDENNIWTVGEIYMNDSLGNPDTKIYNAIHWNGSSWELKRIQTLFRGNLITVPLEGIYAFTPTDIWMVGSLPIHGDGTNWTMYDLRTTVDPNLSLSKVWGSSSTDMYFAGNNGNIAHYQNGRWTKIESGTTLNLTSVSGNIEDVYFSGVNSFTNEGILLKYKSNIVSVIARGKIVGPNEVFNPFLYGEFQAICLLDRTILVGGNFLYQFHFSKWDYVKSLPENFVNGTPNSSIRGFIYSITANDMNDKIISGDGNTLLHFNGSSWLQLGEPYNPISTISHRSTKIFNNIVVTVGYKGNKAMIMKLVR